MAWRNRIALVILLVFAGLPVGGTVCAFVCDSVATHRMTHHGADRKCEEPASPSSGPQVTAASEHDCSTHAFVRPVATTAAERADLSAKSAPAAVGTTQNEVVTFLDPQSPLNYDAPPGTAPPTTRPAVLRA